MTTEADAMPVAAVREIYGLLDEISIDRSRTQSERVSSRD